MQGNRTGFIKYRVRISAISLVINIICFIILQISSYSLWELPSLKILYAFINMGILFVAIGILYVFTNKLWISETIFGGMCTVYAVINIYVVEFHGTPLTIPEFANIKTALNVIKGYSLIEIRPLKYLCMVFILSSINFILLIKIRKFEILTLINMEQKVWRAYWGRRGLIVLGGFVYVTGILHIDSLISPMWEGWVYREAVGKYGYPLYFLASGLEYKIALPIGYTEENVESISIDDYIDKEVKREQAPDIILILNETFYDVSLVMDVETDIDYMDAFYNMDNSISGHVVVPKIGGGTNNSEYELLMGNSTYLMQGITPFQTLDMTNTISIVTNLKDLDYYTIAMHPSFSENYGRNRAYPQIGFDEIHFFEDFENVEYYGNRAPVTDKSAYENMIRWYENALQRKTPIFSYLLTMQNHGEWNTNPPTDDVVHVIDYYNNAYEEKMNEYLSCISLSTRDLCELIEYFKQSDRLVILCMVGDHAPSFIEEISDNNEKNAILQRATPFIIWANFPIDERKDVIVSMNELGPMLLEISGVRMLPYYKYLSKLGKVVPVLTSYGDYIDKDGNICSYINDGKYSKNIQEYFWLEYNNLQNTSLDKWFSLCE